MSELFRKALRSNTKAMVALLGLIVLGLSVGSYILANQRLTPPSWMPVVGEDHFMLSAELETVQGVQPGQGQAVNVSGVKVGDIASVGLEDGRAILTMRLQPRFAHVYPNATVLLRPKTGLKDMVVQLDPGSPSSGDKLEDGARIANESTNPDANPEEFWATLDTDTQDYLRLLLDGAGDALGKGGGRELANAWRRFQPLSRDFDKANRFVVKRRKKLKRVIHNFSAITSELGQHDQELARFVGATSEVFRRFANQNDNLAETLDLLPGALASSNRALGKIDRLGQSMESTFTKLRPLARSLGPSQVMTRDFVRKTGPVIRDQLRPFTREAIPTAKILKPAARDLAKATPDLMDFTDVFNALFNELAYDPPGSGKGKEGYLFYLPWANHNTNSTLNSQDGIGPLRRALVMISCSQLSLFEGLVLPNRFTGKVRNPTVATLLGLLNAPRSTDVCTKQELPR
jgi:phospholipid/cholesterol/gamma-HCH transport system substrate-binding protein